MRTRPNARGVRLGQKRRQQLRPLVSLFDYLRLPAQSWLRDEARGIVLSIAVVLTAAWVLGRA